MTNSFTFLTCDVELDAMMAGGRVLKVDPATVESLVRQRRTVDHQVALAGHLPMQIKPKIGT